MTDEELIVFLKDNLKLELTEKSVLRHPCDSMYRATVNKVSLVFAGHILSEIEIES